MPNPTIVEAKITPSGELIYIVPKKADGSSALFAVSAVGSGATITKNGVTTALDKEIWSPYWSRVAWPVGQGLWSQIVDDNDSATSSTGTWTNHTPFNGTGGHFGTGGMYNMGGTLNGQFRTSVTGTFTWTFTTTGPATYRISVNIWDLVGPDRTTHAVYVVKDGTGTTLASFPVDLTQTIYPRFDSEDYGMPLIALGNVILTTGTTLTVTISNVNGSGFIVADGVFIERMNTPFAVPGDTVTVNLPSGTVTVAGVGTDAVNLTVGFATQADISLAIPDPSARTLKLGYNIDPVRENWLSIGLANRGYGSDVWEGACTLDSHYDMITCTGTVTRRLLYGFSDDRISSRGSYLFEPGDYKIEFNVSGATFDATARANITLTGAGYSFGATSWTDLGGGRWRMTQNAILKPWEPIATRTTDFDVHWTRELQFQSANSGLVITRWKWFDPRTPVGYTGTAHPEDVRRFAGKVKTIRSMDILSTNGSNAAKIGDYTTPADQHMPDASGGPNGVSYGILGCQVLSARPADVNPATDTDQVYHWFDVNAYCGWAVLTVDNASIFQGREGTEVGFGGPHSSSFGSTVSGITIEFGRIFGAYYLDPTHILIMAIASSQYSAGSSPPYTLATLDHVYDLTGCSLGLGKTNQFPLEFFVAYCADVGASPWINVPALAAGLTNDSAFVNWMADITIAATPVGRKIYVEYSNEHWNFGFPQLTWLHSQWVHANWLNLQDAAVHPYTYSGPSALFASRTVLVRDLWRARMVAAGRDPNLIVGVLGSLAVGGQYTQQELQQLVVEGSTIDAVCVDGYQGIDPKGETLHGADLTGSFARLRTGGNIDLINLSTFHANLDGILRLHRLLMNDNGHALSSLFTYESGLDFPGTYSSAGVVAENVRIISSPRIYDFELARMAYLQVACSIEIDNRYRYACYSETGSEHIWTDLLAPFQEPGTGNPAENPNRFDYPNTVSELLGGRLAWASTTTSLITSKASTFSSHLIGNSSLIQGSPTMSLQPALGETITVGFITSGIDGAVIDADTLPTCVVMEDNNDTPILTPTVVKRTGQTGAYRVTFVASTGNGFEVGKCYEIFGSATVGGKVASARLDNFLLRGYSVDSTYNAMLFYGGIQITGTVDASPTPTTSSFHVTLDAPLASTKPVAGIVGQFCTIRGGGAQTEANAIATCTINSLTNLSLTFSGGAVFSVAPTAGNPISISE